MADISNERIHVGTPITSEQAARAVLKLIKSPMLGHIEADYNPGSTIARIMKGSNGGRIYDLLSSGERKLVDIARSIWNPQLPDGAPLSHLGGLDKDNRRKVIIILTYLHLGRDFVFDQTRAQIIHLFGEDISATNSQRD